MEVLIGEDDHDQELILSTLDTGAWSPWISQALYERYARDPPQTTNGAKDADGRPLVLIGEGAIIFKLWDRTYKATAKILPNLPSQFIVRRKFIISVGMNLDALSGTDKFSSTIGGKENIFSGPIISHPETFANVEEAEAIEEEDVDQAIRDMEFPALTNKALKEKLRAVLVKYSFLFKGVGLVKDEEFTIKLKPGVNIESFSQKKR